MPFRAVTLSSWYHYWLQERLARFSERVETGMVALEAERDRMQCNLEEMVRPSLMWHVSFCFICFSRSPSSVHDARVL